MIIELVLIHGVVKAGSDAFPADNTFDFVLTPSQQVSILVIDSGAGANSSFYLTKALSIGTTPAFQIETVPAARVTPQMLEKRSTVILNDTMLPPGLAGGALKRYVERGGGLLVVFGDHSAWPTSEVDLLPGRLGAVVDRTDGRGATIGLDYSHTVFEIFKAPRSGDFSAAASCGIARSNRGPTTASSRGTTMAPSPPWRNASAPAASLRGRRRSTTRGATSP